MKQGIIQVYTGDGKGKTTAAIGLAARAWGRGMRVKVYQLLKAAGTSGEHWAFMVFDPPLPIYALGTGEFIFTRKPTPLEIEHAVKGWELIEESILSNGNDLIVIDELSHALNIGLLDVNTVVSTLMKKPAGLELVLTGRDMPPSILELADLITEMRMVKHPYQQEFQAREGIEF
ncbi:MAG TPA: cob(I)yrinic acid a,c-diamide adenosyltransferase [Firmicutes bacterium]|jgi:cob(I)alamin adenosyltransferase|nr:cob(I)yrinic acid a,c-diamide adenosyltransferase [Bacillota bacterium]